MVGILNGASLALMTSMSSVSSSRISRTRSTTAPLVSPGTIRKFATAQASRGRMLVFVPAPAIVTAVVVRSTAATVGSASSRPRAIQEKGGVRRARRCPRGRCGASASTIASQTPPGITGIGFASRASTARESRPIAPLGGGMLEWPPGARAVIRSEIEPFSAIPIIATGVSSPKSPSWRITMPSSRLYSSSTPRSASSFVIAPAPSSPPSSSSWPKAR